MTVHTMSSERYRPSHSAASTASGAKPFVVIPIEQIEDRDHGAFGEPRSGVLVADVLDQGPNCAARRHHVELFVTSMNRLIARETATLISCGSSVNVIPVRPRHVSSRHGGQNHHMPSGDPETCEQCRPGSPRTASIWEISATAALSA